MLGDDVLLLTQEGHPSLFRCKWQGCDSHFFRNEAALWAHINGAHIASMLPCPFLGASRSMRARKNPLLMRHPLQDATRRSQIFLLWNR